MVRRNRASVMSQQARSFRPPCEGRAPADYRAACSLRSSAAALCDLLRQTLHELLERLVGLLARAVANVDVIGLRLPAADDRHVRHLARLRVADLPLHPL